MNRDAITALTEVGLIAFVPLVLVVAWRLEGLVDRVRTVEKLAHPARRCEHCNPTGVTR